MSDKQMEENKRTENRNEDKQITIGILAHVDAGKTTLSEQLLFHGGAIRKMGRVDHQDAFLDTDEMERQRGITIFAKEARATLGGRHLILLDTPGHVDFSAEMERTLGILDYGILLISAADGVTEYTKTLWRMLRLHQIPSFVFVNKMDMFEGSSRREEVLAQLRSELSDQILDFCPDSHKAGELCEQLAMCDEGLLELYLAAQEKGEDADDRSIFPEERIAEAVRGQKVFPCYFGSALKGQGIEEFLGELPRWLAEKDHPDTFGARIYKVSRDEKGQRQVHVRITGGSLSVRDEVAFETPADNASDNGSDTMQTRTVREKVTQIRLYNGEKYETVQSVSASQTAVLCGLTLGEAGMGLGFEEGESKPTLTPLLSYRISGPDEVPASQLLSDLKILEEESPELSISYDEEKKQIHALLMGEVQIEILRHLMQKRFGVDISLDEGEVLYRETIADTAYGVGHFEPLRHYAEVHLLLEPGERGSGLVFATRLSSDLLATNWKRLIMTHLSEKVHRGVLTGSPITDMKITLVAGKAHPKHTEGGDFRQATYRAVRQGLMQAESVLLEPYCRLQISLPKSLVGRVLTDLDKLSGSGEVTVMEEESAQISGRAPLSTVRNYAGELASFSGGRGRISLQYDGYDLCHNAQEVILQKGYDPQADTRNRADSVFTAYGSSQIVPWDEVFEHMHLEKAVKEDTDPAPVKQQTGGGRSSGYAGEDELKEIFERTFKSSWEGTRRPQQDTVFVGGKPEKSAGSTDGSKQRTKEGNDEREQILYVDGYNVLHADPKLAEMAKENMDRAREALLNMLGDYQGTQSGRMVVVFDAYRRDGQQAHTEKSHTIEVVYTARNETADMYIEKEVNRLGRKAKVTVATSDGVERIVSSARGAQVISARSLLEMIADTKKRLQEEYLQSQKSLFNPVIASRRPEK
ncbi:MAG: NYN domain-containing protein [Lachnospiraceae bacterium]|nr:NYN domain-containing protein [Lachnospiraceae bacterium]